MWFQYICTLPTLTFSGESTRSAIFNLKNQGQIVPHSGPKCCTKTCGLTLFDRDFSTAASMGMTHDQQHFDTIRRRVKREFSRIRLDSLNCDLQIDKGYQQVVLSGLDNGQPRSILVKFWWVRLHSLLPSLEIEWGNRDRSFKVSAPTRVTRFLTFIATTNLMK